MLQDFKGVIPAEAHGAAFPFREFALRALSSTIASLGFLGRWLFVLCLGMSSAALAEVIPSTPRLLLLQRVSRLISHGGVALAQTILPQCPHVLLTRLAVLQKMSNPVAWVGLR